MARERQFADPISVPFRWETKDRIVQLAEELKVAQADLVRWAVDHGGLNVVEETIREKGRNYYR